MWGKQRSKVDFYTCHIGNAYQISEQSCELGSGPTGLEGRSRLELEIWKSPAVFEAIGLGEITKGVSVYRKKNTSKNETQGTLMCRSWGKKDSLTKGTEK